VLVVDDEPRNQRIITEALEHLIEYKLASSGSEALDLARSYLPDLILLDIMMPGMDGYEVCRQIKADPALELSKVILVSGKAMIEERLKGYAVGADDYMTKPFIPEELVAKAQVFLRLSRLERDQRELNRSLDGKLLDTELKLVNAAKMSALGEMAGGIAHEINTPLGTIGMIAEHLKDLVIEEPLDKKTVTDMILVVSRTVTRIATIIRGLRTFSRDGSGDPFEPAPLKQILEDTLVLCREKLKQSGTELRLEGIKDDLILQCRAVQVSQVLLNLVGNACDAIAQLPDKWVGISARVVGEQIEISVADSGSGIPPDARAKLFQPFFTTKEIGLGTGLGLSISKGIAEAHQGSLELDVECPNTRFVLKLPIFQQAAL
jgi:C4-dicarboxylate-specific signal transduction histidine kinase